MKKITTIIAGCALCVTASSQSMPSLESGCPEPLTFSSEIDQVETLGGGLWCHIPEDGTGFPCGHLDPFPGLKVRVTISYVDGCHKPGACRQNACFKSLTAAVEGPCKQSM